MDSTNITKVNKICTYIKALGHMYPTDIINITSIKIMMIETYTKVSFPYLALNLLRLVLKSLVIPIVIDEIFDFNL